MRKELRKEDSVAMQAIWVTTAAAVQGEELEEEQISAALMAAERVSVIAVLQECVDVFPERLYTE